MTKGPDSSARKQQPVIVEVALLGIPRPFAKVVISLRKPACCWWRFQECVHQWCQGEVMAFFGSVKDLNYPVNYF